MQIRKEKIAMPNQRPTNEELKQRMQGKEFLSGQELTSVNAENRTVDCIFFTGIDVPRKDWWTGQNYVLRFDPKGGDFSLLNNGAPILDNHSCWDGSSSQKGKVEKAWQDGKNSKATLRFSKRKSVDELWQDIEDQISTKFSMGVSILAEEKLTENNQEIRLAKKWQPFELSVAPIPADFGTTTLSAVDGNNNMGTRPEGEEMPKEVVGTGAQITEAPAVAVDEVALKRQAMAEERNRISELQKIGASHKLDATFIQNHVDLGTTVADFGVEVLKSLANRQAQEPPTQGVHATVDERDKRILAMEIALTGMMNPKERKADNGNDFIGLSILRFAEESVRRQHGLSRIPSRDEVVKLSMQNSSDFAYVLENVARKQLLNQYQLATPTYRTWCKMATTPDFKTMSRVRLSESPEFLLVPENGQIQPGKMSDTKESYAIYTYGRSVVFSRQMLINDDLQAFNGLVGQFGSQAARKENKLVYAKLYSCVMADGQQLFYVTTHFNVYTGTLSNTGFDTMFQKMASQTGLDGSSVLNIVPKYVIVPKAKETTARMALVAITSNVKASDQNYFTGRLEVVADAELDNNGSGTTIWYGAADPNIFPGMEVTHLEGQEGPQMYRTENEGGVLGLQFYAFLDFGCAPVDWRPLYKSSGS
jgi:hypothetical protein